MDGNGGKVRRTEAEWQGIVEAAKRSGTTGSGYCRAQGIDYRQFLYHRRKILPKNAGALATSGRRVSVPASVMAPRAFIPIEVGRRCSSVGSGRLGVRLEFPCGLVLGSEELPPAAWLVEVAARWAGGEVGPC